MSTILLAEATFMTMVAFLLQASLTITFAREAIFTKEGNLCRVKCTLAVLMYGTIAVPLAWLTLIKSVG